MSPLDVVLKAGEIALRHGPEVVKAWALIEQSLRSEHPELVRTPLPDMSDVEAARAAAIARARSDADEGP